MVKNLLSGKGGGGKINATLTKAPGTDDAMLFFCDVQKLKAMLTSKLQKEGEQETADKVKLALERLGLDQLDSVVCRTGFLDLDMVMNSYIPTPAPHAGLPACLKPISSSAWKMIPADVMAAIVCHIDPAGIYDTILHTLQGLIEPDEYRVLQNNLTEAEAKVGIKIRDGFLEALDGQVVMYVGSPAPGLLSPVGNFIYMFKLKNTPLLKNNLASLENFIKGLITQGMVQITSQEIEGESVRVAVVPFLAMMQMMPCWTVAEDQLIFASNTTACAAQLAALKLKKPPGDRLSIGTSLRVVP